MSKKKDSIWIWVLGGGLLLFLLGQSSTSDAAIRNAIADKVGK